MFCPVVSIGLGLKEENAGQQVSGNPKINDAQSNSRFKQFIVVHQDVWIKNEVERWFWRHLGSYVMIRFGRLPYAQKSIQIICLQILEPTLHPVNILDRVKRNDEGLFITEIGYWDFSGTLQNKITVLSKNFVKAANHIHLKELWEPAAFAGWRPSSAPRIEWPPPTKRALTIC